MSIFSKKKSAESTNDNQPNFAELALRSIHDGVMMIDREGIVRYINPAGAIMLDCGSPENALGLSYELLFKIESKEGRELLENENPIYIAIHTHQPVNNRAYCMVAGAQSKRIPVAISVLPVEDGGNIVTFRNIAKELAEEGEQTEFISTASHEMRTPVATIDGYISLALNPQTATIDERARGYLESAHAASQHLGKLFRDLLDVTKLDDGRVRANCVPIEMKGEIKKISDDYIVRMKEAGIEYRFGSKNNEFGDGAMHIDQVVYGFVDLDFLREIMDNLLDNAIKYTPSGGSVYVGVLGDGDRVLINVTDTGIGISSDDLQHIFQKFYRSDNSDTREIGGTGLGLYLVKQRVEAMGGKVWAESAFGDGSTFYVSLPRLSSDEYEKRMIAVQNANMVQQSSTAPAPALPTTPIISSPNEVVSQPMVTQPVPQPVPQPALRPAAPQPVPQPAPQPAAPQVAPQPIQQPAPVPQPLAPQPQPIQQVQSPPIQSPPTQIPVPQQTISTNIPNNNNLNGGITQ